LKKYLLYGCQHSYGEPEEDTAYKLAESWSHITLVDRLDPEEDYSEQILVRLGSREQPQFDDRFKLVINKAENISQNVHKLNSLKIMQAAGVRVPQTYEEPKVPSNLFADQPAVLGRKIHHTKGRDIEIIFNHKQLYNDGKSEFWVDFVPSLWEFRFHIYGNFVGRVSLKVPMSEDADLFIRNYERGWCFDDDFQLSHPSIFYSLREESLKAVKSLGLDFGAVDILFSTNFEPVVLEINSDPKLNQLGRRAFVHGIEKIIDKKLRKTTKF
jgi:hypothetical protein